MSFNSLPDCWVVKQTGSVFEQIPTALKKIKTKDCKSIGLFPVIDQGQSIIAGYVDDSEKVINVTIPLVIFGDHTRAIKWVSKNFVPGADGIKVLEAKVFLEPKFFYYQLLSIELPDRGYARHFKFLKESEFVVAPLAEQKQIATKLDELLAQVDTLKTRLENILTILKRFRQSVLAAAVSGKLTEKWRQVHPPKKSETELKEKIREYRNGFWIESQMAKYKAKGKIPKNDNWKNKYLEPPKPSDEDQIELPKGWVYEPLDGLVYIAARIGWKGLKASEYTKKGPLFLSVHSLNYGQYVNLDEAFHISKDRYEESPEIKLFNDDILLCKDGAGIGKIAIVKDLDEPASINSSLLLIRAGKYFKTKYLYYFLAGPVMQKLVQERMTGTAVPHLFQRDVKEFLLEVPPIEEQSEIIRCVEQLFTFADLIEQRVKDAQKRVNHLTQSILAKAFRGGLTNEWREQNPDLISGENSAEALLERIKTEREAMVPKKRPRRKKTA